MNMFKYKNKINDGACFTKKYLGCIVVDEVTNNGSS